MNTPLPVYVKSHKGVKTNPLVSQYNLNVIKASLRTYELPIGITISRNGDSTLYRATWEVKVHNSYHYASGWSDYAQIIEYTKNSQRACEYSGRSPSLKDHNKFMETFRSISPIIDQLFSR